MVWLSYLDETNLRQTQGFKTLTVYDKPIVEQINFTDLRTQRGSHIKGITRKYEVSITADELRDTAKYSFVQLFWVSGGKQMSFDGSSFFDVTTDGGEMPVEFIEGISDLPEVKFIIFKNGF